MATERPKRSVGRPRQFAEDEALEAAMKVFWQQGYEGASLSDLTRATGLSRPSLYAAFGNKEALFRTALDHYADTHMAFMRRALQEPTAREVVDALLRGFIASATDPRTPAGCLTVGAALTSGPSADAVRAELTARRLAGEETFPQTQAHQISRATSAHSPRASPSRPPMAPHPTNSTASSTSRSATGQPSRRGPKHANERYTWLHAEQGYRCATHNTMHLIGRLSNPPAGLAFLLG
jgi:AcrR family transcriptional regulator